MDARYVIEEVNYRIQHPEDQTFQEEDLEELAYWTRGATDQPTFTMGTVMTDSMETAKGKQGTMPATNRVVKWKGF